MDGSVFPEEDTSNVKINVILTTNSSGEATFNMGEMVLKKLVADRRTRIQAAGVKGLDPADAGVMDGKHKPTLDMCYVTDQSVGAFTVVEDPSKSEPTTLVALRLETIVHGESHGSHISFTHTPTFPYECTTNVQYGVRDPSRSSEGEAFCVPNSTMTTVTGPTASKTFAYITPNASVYTSSGRFAENLDSSIMDAKTGWNSIQIAKSGSRSYSRDGGQTVFDRTFTNDLWDLVVSQVYTMNLGNEEPKEEEEDTRLLVYLGPGVSTAGRQNYVQEVFKDDGEGGDVQENLVCLETRLYNRFISAVERIEKDRRVHNLDGEVVATMGDSSGTLADRTFILELNLVVVPFWDDDAFVQAQEKETRRLTEGAGAGAGTGYGARAAVAPPPPPSRHMSTSSSSTKSRKGGKGRRW